MAVTGHRDKKSFRRYTHRTGAGTDKVIESSKVFNGKGVFRSLEKMKTVGKTVGKTGV